MATHHIHYPLEEFSNVEENMFDIRKDEGYELGDLLILEEVDSNNLVPFYNGTNRNKRGIITSLIKGKNSGLQDGYVAIGFGSEDLKVLF